MHEAVVEDECSDLRAAQAYWNTSIQLGSGAFVVNENTGDSQTVDKSLTLFFTATYRAGTMQVDSWRH